MVFIYKEEIKDIIDRNRDDFSYKSRDSIIFHIMKVIGINSNLKNRKKIASIISNLYPNGIMGD